MNMLSVKMIYLMFEVSKRLFPVMIFSNLLLAKLSLPPLLSISKNPSMQSILTNVLSSIVISSSL